MLDPTRYALDAATVGFRKRMGLEVHWDAFHNAIENQTDAIKVRRELEETKVTELHVMGGQRYGLEGNSKTNELARQKRQMNGYPLRSFLATGGAVVLPLKPQDRGVMATPMNMGLTSYAQYNGVVGNYVSKFVQPLWAPLENNTQLLGRTGQIARSESASDPYKALQFQMNLHTSLEDIRRNEANHQTLRGYNRQDQQSAIDEAANARGHTRSGNQMAPPYIPPQHPQADEGRVILAPPAAGRQEAIQLGEGQYMEGNGEGGDFDFERHLAELERQAGSGEEYTGSYLFGPPSSEDAAPINRKQTRFGGTDYALTTDEMNDLSANEIKVFGERVDSYTMHNKGVRPDVMVEREIYKAVLLSRVNIGMSRDELMRDIEGKKQQQMILAAQLNDTIEAQDDEDEYFNASEGPLPMSSAESKLEATIVKTARAQFQNTPVKNSDLVLEGGNAFSRPSPGFVFSGSHFLNESDGSSFQSPTISNVHRRGGEEIYQAGNRGGQDPMVAHRFPGKEKKLKKSSPKKEQEFYPPTKKERRKIGTMKMIRPSTSGKPRTPEEEKYYKIYQNASLSDY